MRNETTGTSLDRLREALNRLGMERGALLQDMRRTARGQDQALRLVIEEIDEIVLPRRIDLVSDAGLGATLIASNRRLIDLRGTGLPQTSIAEEDGDADTAALRHVRSIRAVADRAGSIALRPVGRSSSPGSGATSCTARSLAQAGRSMGQEARINRFLERIAPRAIGWICDRGDGAEVLAQGPDDVRDRLASLDTVLTGARHTSGRPERLERAGPTCTVLAMGPGLQAVVARDGRSRLLAAVSETDTNLVLATWTDVFGRPGQSPGAR